MPRPMRSPPATRPSASVARRTRPRLPARRSHSGRGSAGVIRARGRWPHTLQLVRHAESCGNVARDSAELKGLATIDIAERDMDVALSERGREQAAALGRWLGDLGRARPTVVVSSPYVRAEQTARI